MAGGGRGMWAPGGQTEFFNRSRKTDLAVRAPGFQILAMSYTFFENTEQSRPTEKQAAFSPWAASHQPLTWDFEWQRFGSLQKRQPRIYLF